MSRRFQFQKKTLFLVTIFMAVFTVSEAFAMLVFVKQKGTANLTQFDVTDDTTIADLRNGVAAAGFDPSTLTYQDKAGPKPLGAVNGPLISSYNLREGAMFIAERAPDRRAQFLAAARDTGDVDAINALLEAFNASQAEAFISGCLDRTDHDKTALYFAARHGRLEVLQAIRAKVGNARFSQLLTSLDSENRTILMAAAQATSNRADMIDYVKVWTPPAYQTRADDNGCSAYDWAVLRGYNDHATLSRLLDTKNLVYASHPSGHRCRFRD